MDEPDRIGPDDQTLNRIINVYNDLWRRTRGGASGLNDEAFRVTLCGFSQFAALGNAPFPTDEENIDRVMKVYANQCALRGEPTSELDRPALAVALGVVARLP